MPHPEWKPIDVRYHSWRVSQILAHLKTHPTAGKAQFYVWLDDVTFPLLDQIKSKLDAHRTKNGGLYPMYAGGPLTPVNFYHSYWKEHQSKAYNLFKSSKLQSSPGWLFGFSPTFLAYLGEFVHPDTCPTLFGDDLAIAAMVQCAGGVLPDARWQFGLFSLDKKSPEELQLTQPSATLDQWRKADAYHGVAKDETMQQCTKAYYEKAGVKLKA